MSFFGVELNAQVNRLVLEIRLTLTKNKYLPNFRTIYQSLAKYDTEQSGWVSPQHFEKVTSFPIKGPQLKRNLLQEILMAGLLEGLPASGHHQLVRLHLHAPRTSQRHKGSNFR